MESLIGDLRHTVRQLLRRRSYAVTAVLTLSLALGATTAMFSVVSGVLLRPLPFPDPDRLVTICERHPSVEGYCVASPPDVSDWDAEVTSFASIGLARGWPLHLSVEDRIESVYGGLATAGFFAALGVQPARGRLMARSEHGPTHRVAVLSDALWRSRFGGDSSVVGGTIVINGDPHLVVGVLPPTTAVPGLEDVRLWTSLPFDPRDEENRGWRGFRAVGRLAPGVRREAAAAELAGVERGLAERHPHTNRDWTTNVVDLHEYIVGDVRDRLLVFLGAVGLVLLLGCANLANVTLARATTRTHELAVRAALGASRGRLARLVLLESLLISVVGAALGVLLAAWGVDLFRTLAPPGIPRLDAVAMDWRVLLFALALAGLTTALIGAAPAWRGARSDLAPHLHARRVVPGRGRGILVTVETAVAVTLLVGAALLARTFVTLTSWDPGFARSDLRVAWTSVSHGSYRTSEAVRGLFGRALEAVRALPGVASVSLASGGPLFGGPEPGMAIPAARTDSVVVRWYDVGPDYFATLGVPLRAGREFTAADREGQESVAIVNETLARRFWPDRPPVGERLTVRVAERDFAFTVVGVAGDVSPFHPDDPQAAEVYWPFMQRTRWASFFVVRAPGAPAGLARALGERLREVSPELEPSSVSALDDLVDRRLVSPRFNATLLGTFAVVALLLAAVGIAGLVTYRVSHRVREIGIRMALGATTRDVVGHFAWEGGVLVAAGVVAGTLGALALTRLLRSMLAGTSPTDPPTFLAVVGAMLAIGLTAAAIPALRASRISPLEALRTE